MYRSDGFPRAVNYDTTKITTPEHCSTVEDGAHDHVSLEVGCKITCTVYIDPYHNLTTHREQNQQD